MAIKLILTRTEAEDLVELLENCDKKVVGSWRHDIADDIRKLCGMYSLEEEMAKCNRHKPVEPSE